MFFYGIAAQSFFLRVQVPDLKLIFCTHHLGVMSGLCIYSMFSSVLRCRYACMSVFGFIFLCLCALTLGPPGEKGDRGNPGIGERGQRGATGPPGMFHAHIYMLKLIYLAQFTVMKNLEISLIYWPVFFLFLRDSAIFYLMSATFIFRHSAVECVMRYMMKHLKK